MMNIFSLMKNNKFSPPPFLAVVAVDGGAGQSMACWAERHESKQEERTLVGHD